MSLIAGKRKFSETTALPKWPLTPLAPIFLSTSDTPLTNDEYYNSGEIIGAA